MDYTRYSRAVIMLEEKNREFAIRPGEEMKGYLRVETGNGRGAIRCVMQNVKYFPRSEYTYQLILFGKRGERTIHTILGTIPISQYGTGEVYLRFHPQDVDGQGNDYGRYTTAIIAAVSTGNPKEQLHPVLMGKTGHEEAESRVTAMAQMTATADSAEAAEAPATADSAEAAPESGRDSTEAAPDAAANRRRTYNGFYGTYLKGVCAYLCSVSGYYREIRPFRDALKGARWMKIDNPKTMFLVSPGAHHFAEKYGHFLLGRSGDDGGESPLRYYVAVPGRFRWEDQPDGGESGFQYWLALEEGAAGPDAYGYWIAAIDGDSGEIFSPVQE